MENREQNVSFIVMDPTVDLSSVPGLKITSKEGGVCTATVSEEGRAALEELNDSARISSSFRDR